MRSEATTQQMSENVVREYEWNIYFPARQREFDPSDRRLQPGLSLLSWKWIQRSSVETTERTVKGVFRERAAVFQQMGRTNCQPEQERNRLSGAQDPDER